MSGKYYCYILFLFCHFLSKGQIFRPYLQRGHIDAITELAFDVQGKNLISRDKKDNVIIWDFFSHNEIMQIQPRKGQNLTDIMDSLWGLKRSSSSDSAQYHFELGKGGHKIKCFHKKDKIFVIPKDFQNFISVTKNADDSRMCYISSEKSIFLRSIPKLSRLDLIQCRQTPTVVRFHPILADLLVVGFANGDIGVYNIHEKALAFSLMPSLVQPLRILQDEEIKNRILVQSDQAYFSFDLPNLSLAYFPVNINNEYNTFSAGFMRAGNTVAYAWKDYHVYKIENDSTKHFTTELNQKIFNKYIFPAYLTAVLTYSGLVGMYTLLELLPYSNLQRVYEPSLNATSSKVYLSILNRIKQFDSRSQKLMNKFCVYGEGTIQYVVNDKWLVAYRDPYYLSVYNLEKGKLATEYFVPQLKSFALAGNNDLLTVQLDSTFKIVKMSAPGISREFPGIYLNQTDNNIYSTRHDSLFLTKSQSQTEKFLFKSHHHLEMKFIHAAMVGNGDPSYYVFYNTGLIDYVGHNGTLIGSLYYFTDGQFLIMSPDNYFYISSKSLLKGITMVRDDTHETYSLDQFESKFFRPDIMFERMNLRDSLKLALYKLASEKNAEKFKGDLTGSIPTNFPVSMITDWNNKYFTRDSLIRCHVTFKASGSDLKSINIRINNVPLWGDDGYDISGKKVSSFDTIVMIPLIKGDNYVKPVCEDNNEKRSFVTSYFIKADYNSVPKIYFLGIGLSQYADSSHTLEYSHKDISNISQAFKDKHNEVFIPDSVFDMGADKQTILACIKRLEKVSVNDKVVIAFSGHGLLDDSLRFYLSTYEVKFKHPEQNGLAYAEFEAAIKKIPARRKLILIDACNSGEIFQRGRQMRDGQTLISDSLNEQAFYLMNEIYSDLKKDDGTVILSAVRGKQAAQEGSAWENSAFSHALIIGLKDHLADANKDGEITVQEIKNFVIKEVLLFSKGTQRPTFRKDNVDYDWVLY